MGDSKWPSWHPFNPALEHPFDPAPDFEHQGAELADELKLEPWSPFTLIDTWRVVVVSPELADDLRAIRAQSDLVRWALETARRDELVRAAVRAGVDKTQIHRLTGIARTTVDRIVGTVPR